MALLRQTSFPGPPNPTLTTVGRGLVNHRSWEGAGVFLRSCQLRGRKVRQAGNGLDGVSQPPAPPVSGACTLFGDACGGARRLKLTPFSRARYPIAAKRCTELRGRR